MFVTRLTSGGRLDSSFGTNGTVTISINGGGGMDSGAAMALQPNGKIVIVGGAPDGPYGPTMFAAVRLNTNGSLDQTFGHGGIASIPIGTYSIANAVVIEPDGKIALAGTALNGHNEFAAARLNPNGTIDTSFGSGGTVTLDPTGGAWGMILQQDGKLVLAGQADYDNPNVSNAQQFMAARLNTDGTLDTGFAQNGIAMIPVGQTSLGFGIAQTDNKLLITGIAFTFTNANAIVRLNPDGTIDPSYGDNGIGTILTTHGTNGIVLDSTGRPVLPIVGPGAERFNTNGTPDTTFGTNGTALVTGTTGGANGAATQTDGKIIIAGAITINGQVELEVARFDAADAVATTNPPEASTTSAATTAATTTPPTRETTASRSRPKRVQAYSAAACPVPEPRHRRSHSHRDHARGHRHRRVAHRLLMRPALGCTITSA
jgi:uncharacterized delta-60 repeat protein